MLALYTALYNRQCMLDGPLELIKTSRERGEVLFAHVGTQTHVGRWRGAPFCA